MYVFSLLLFEVLFDSTKRNAVAMLLRRTMDMYLVIQSFPEEKVIFASISEEIAFDFFHIQVAHGKGWFELRKEENGVPLLTGGEHFFFPYHPDKWKKQEDRVSGTEEDSSEVNQHLFPVDKNRYILPVWE